MSPEEFKNKMAEFDNYDEEVSHMKADDLMCEVLESLGYKEGIEIFNNMAKWYA